jgi:hypothetical protein
MEFENSLVITTLGEIPQRDLQTTTAQVAETLDTWTVARECRYIGSAFPQHSGEIVRRDVWVTLKRGQTAQAASNL